MTIRQGLSYAIALLVFASLPTTVSADYGYESYISYSFQDSLPSFQGEDGGMPIAEIAQSAVMLSGVPSSKWTYGCSATSAGMMFGYYDRYGYSNMYTGPYDNGLAPLSDLGELCSLIASKSGLDGLETNGHVDDYWSSYGASGPDPFEGQWNEHVWGDCIADYLGTNQWKWDINGDGIRDRNTDGSTTLYSYNGPWKLYDYIPDITGAPQTALSHGLRLFAESRGYSVIQNYTQKIDSMYNGGFSFVDYMTEINSGRPVMIQLAGHSMVGVGYDPNSQAVYVHDTWDNYVHSLAWGGTYSGMQFQAVTVLELASIGSSPVPEPAGIIALLAGLSGAAAFLRVKKPGF